MSGAGTSTTPKITSKTPVPEIVRLLSESGCPDITSQLNIPQCSQFSVNGGGYGDIYQGVLNDGGYVAIKTTRGDQSLDLLEGNIAFKRIARELHTWFTLSHQNVAKLLGMAVFRGHIAMVSPWVEPGDFYRFIQRSPEADRFDLCLQVADGLAYLHENGIIFGDLKAQNVLVGFDGTARITGFGLSILKQSRIVFSTTENPGGGSSRWMAPEIIQGLTGRTLAADVYALAMTSIEFLTDQLPFPEMGLDLQVMFAVVSNGAVPGRPGRLRAQSPHHEQWWLLLNRCWDREPNMRPKASDWRVLYSPEKLDRRIQQLSEQLLYVLRYGRTSQGSLNASLQSSHLSNDTNIYRIMDTGEELTPDEENTIFHVPEFYDEASFHMFLRGSLQTLVGLDSPGSSIWQHTSARTCGHLIQDQIYSRYLLSLGDQDIGDLFEKLDAAALAMRAVARLCLSCYQTYQLLRRHAHAEHVRGNHAFFAATNPEILHTPTPLANSLYLRARLLDYPDLPTIQEAHHERLPLPTSTSHTTSSSPVPTIPLDDLYTFPMIPALNLTQTSTDFLRSLETPQECIAQSLESSRYFQSLRWTSEPVDIFCQPFMDEVAVRTHTQDLSHVWFTSPRYRGAVHGLQWRQDLRSDAWYESIVLQAAGARSGEEEIWWICLERFAGRNVAIISRNPDRTKGLESKIRAETTFEDGLPFEYVLRVLDVIHETLPDRPIANTSSWLYASIIFQMLSLQQNDEQILVNWIGEKTATYWERQIAEIYKGEYSRIEDRVRQLPEFSFSDADYCSLHNGSESALSGASEERKK